MMRSRPDPWRPLPPLPPTLVCSNCGEPIVLVHTATIFGVSNYEHRSGICKGRNTDG